MTAKERIVIVGNGMAGGKLAFSMLPENICVHVSNIQAAMLAQKCLNRALSRTVPEPMIRFRAQPVCFSAT